MVTPYPQGPTSLQHQGQTTMVGKPLGGVISTRSNNKVILPPGILGYNHLLVPDEFTGSDGAVVKNFKANIHYTAAQLEAFTSRVRALVVDALWPAFLKEAKDAGFEFNVQKDGRSFVEHPWEHPSTTAWVDGQVMPGREDTAEGLPFICFKNRADYKDRKSGLVKLKVMRLTDSTGANALDFAQVKMARGSIVQPIVTGGLYASGVITYGLPAVSLKLQGLRLIKLEQYGSNNPVGEISEEDLALAGADVSPDDLSAYVQRPTGDVGMVHQENTFKESPHGERYEPAADLDDDLPF